MAKPVGWSPCPRTPGGGFVLSEAVFQRPGPLGERGPYFSPVWIRRPGQFLVRLASVHRLLKGTAWTSADPSPVLRPRWNEHFLGGSDRMHTVTKNSESWQF